MIQLFKHHVYQESVNNVTEVLKSGWTGLGPKVQEFENAVAKYLNAPFAIATNSGTSALQLAIASLGSPKDKNYIITTPLTFISTNHSIIQAGYIPLFADIEPTTGNIDPKSIQKFMDSKFINHRVKAIIVVHYGGMPVDLDAIYDISNKYNIDVIEDAAHAFGAEYDGEKIGCLHSKLVCFSFHSVKPLAIGDGGMLTTYDPGINELARQLRWCGIDKNTAERINKEDYKWDYDVKVAGFKSHMNDIQAAIGLGQLQHYEDDKLYKQALVCKYREYLKDIKGIELLDTFTNRISANHLFVIKCHTKEMKERIMKHLYDNSIQTGCHYRPSTMYSMYKKAETDGGCESAIDFFERAISLPLHIELTEEDVKRVTDIVKQGI